MRALLALALLAGLCPFTGCGGERSGRDAEPVLLGAATSLRHVLPRLIAAFQGASPGLAIEATYAASGTLRQQVEAGAPLDALILAGGKDIDALVAAHRMVLGSRQVVASNVLVLIGHAASPDLTFATLGQSGAGQVAIGDPASVPAGRYAQQALTALGAWEALQGRLVLAQDVASVLAYVRRTEVGAGVVYATELRGVEGVRLLERAQGPWAPRPEVVACCVADARAPARAQAFLAFLTTPQARAIWQEAGFGPP